jgi:uncharacterized protein
MTPNLTEPVKKPRKKKGTDATATTDGFINLTARMGLGAHNVLSQGTYINTMLTENRVQLENLYLGSWIVGQCIDAMAEDMTRAGILIQGSDEPKAILKMSAALINTGAWRALREATQWGRLYGGAVAMIQIDGQDPSTPLKVDTVGKGQFTGLRVFDRWQLQPSITDIVQEGPHAGLPNFYRVISDVNSGTVSNVNMHHSRAIRCIGIHLPIYQALVHQLWGESIVERLYDRLLSFDTATSGAANLVQKAHLRTVQIDKLREVLAAGGQAETNLLTMFHHMRMLQNNEGLTLLDKEDTFAAHSYTFAGLSDIILQFGQQIAGATGIPLVRLFGQSPAGLNSTGESDMRMYYDHVNAQQEARLREGVMRVLHVLHRSVLGTAVPEDFDFEFKPLWQTDATERATNANTITTAVTTAFEKGVIDQPTALRELKQSSDATGVYSNITDDLITEAENAPPPVPVETQPVEPVPGKKTAMERIKDWLS